jgi:hypothetical protein
MLITATKDIQVDERAVYGYLELYGVPKSKLDKFAPNLLS